MDREPGPAGLHALVRDGVVDAELAALLWLLMEARLPFVVAGEPADDRAAVRAVLLGLQPPGTRRVELRGTDEAFDWLPEATDLGWRSEAAASRPGATTRQVVSPASTVLVADLEPGPRGTWGERARVAIRASAIGYGLAATAGGDRLEDVLGRLAAAPVAAMDDELTRLGVVLILGADSGAQLGYRVAAAHYLRPVQRDVHGHVQRMAPAVLATWDGGAAGFQHFAWGIADELAARTGRRPIELDREQATRASLLARPR